MQWNDRSKFAGRHALLSPSKYAWVNYEEDKMDNMVVTAMTAQRGTQLHELAKQLIDLKVKLPETTATLSQYVNDCIGFRMQTEQTLYYSPNCFGHTDAISFRQKKNARPMLRIADLKNGVTKASMVQLRIYAALFCLEYGYKPTEIDMELRIYQNDDVEIEIGDPLDITSIMDRIVYFDRRINELREEVHG